MEKSETVLAYEHVMECWDAFMLIRHEAKDVSEREATASVAYDSARKHYDKATAAQRKLVPVSMLWDAWVRAREKYTEVREQEAVALRMYQEAREAYNTALRARQPI